MQETSVEGFFSSKFQLLGETQSFWPVTDIHQKYKQYKQQTLSHPKPIKEYGFMKKYPLMNEIFPYVSSFRPVTLEKTLIELVIDLIYNRYLQFCKNGGWKCQDLETHIEQYLINVLSTEYTQISGQVKKTCPQFDKFLLCFCYTLNYLKTCSSFVMTFVCFLNGTYCLGELFVYISLRNVSTKEEGKEKVPAGIIMKVLKIMDEGSVQHSLSISEEIVMEDESKMININKIFNQSSVGALMIGRVRMYKIMKLCRVVETRATSRCHRNEENIDWNEFLKIYFNNLESETEITFQQILAASVSQSLYEMSMKMFPKGSQPQNNFLEDAFTYVFNILQIVYYDKDFHNQSINTQDKKTKSNLHYLRELYVKAKTLNCFDIVVTKRFAKIILKNSYLLQLYRKYK